MSKYDIDELTRRLALLDELHEQFSDGAPDEQESICREMEQHEYHVMAAAPLLLADLAAANAEVERLQGIVAAGASAPARTFNGHRWEYKIEGGKVYSRLNHTDGAWRPDPNTPEQILQTSFTETTALAAKGASK
jgi:hypothetical protein